jgi:hypothetical protein
MPIPETSGGQKVSSLHAATYERRATSGGRLETKKKDPL